MDTLNLPPAWRDVVGELAGAPTLAALQASLAQQEAAGTHVFPPRTQRFAALELTPPGSVKVVILGQDPYHGPGQANGLAFSVADGIRQPPSLVNIFKELASDLGLPRPAHGNLEGWARQGVLLLNNALTVEAGKAGSHQKRGWDILTDAVVAAAARAQAPSVFMLWGNHAQGKAARIPDLASGRHLVIKAPHPSPLSAYAGFFGSRPFTRANAFLEANGRGAIDWGL